METVMIMKILSIALQHGVPAVMEGVEALNKENITLEDVDALGESMKAPDAWRSSDR